MYHPRNYVLPRRGRRVAIYSWENGTEAREAKPDEGYLSSVAGLDIEDMIFPFLWVFHRPLALSKKSNGARRKKITRLNQTKVKRWCTFNFTAMVIST